MGDLAGKTVIVRGASAGSIGFAIAEAFAQEGANIVVVSSSAKKCDDVRAFEDIYGIQVKPIIIKTPDETSIKEALDSISAEFPSIDILINCVLFSKVDFIDELSAKDLQEALQIDVLDAFSWMKAAYPALRVSKGCVLNLVSESALQGMPALGALGAASAALQALSKTAAHEWEDDGILVETFEQEAQTSQFKKWAKEFPDQAQTVFEGGEPTELSSAGERCLLLAKAHYASLG